MSDSDEMLEKVKAESLDDAIEALSLHMRIAQEVFYNDPTRARRRHAWVGFSGLAAGAVMFVSFLLIAGGIGSGLENPWMVAYVLLSAYVSYCHFRLGEAVAAPLRRRPMVTSETVEAWVAWLDSGLPREGGFPGWASRASPTLREYLAKPLRRSEKPDLSE